MLVYLVEGVDSYGIVVGQYGVLIVNVDGSYVYVLNVVVINVLLVGNEMDMFIVQIIDVYGVIGMVVLMVYVKGVNDVFMLDDVILVVVSEDIVVFVGVMVCDFFGFGFYDVDIGVSLIVVVIIVDNVLELQGVWQYEVVGSNQWIDIFGVSGSSVFVFVIDILICFVLVVNYSGVFGMLEVYVFDNIYVGGSIGVSLVLIDIVMVGFSVFIVVVKFDIEIMLVVDMLVFKGFVVNYFVDVLIGSVVDISFWNVVLLIVINVDYNDFLVMFMFSGVILYDCGYLEMVLGFYLFVVNFLYISLSFSWMLFVEVIDGIDGMINLIYGEQVNGILYYFGFGNGLIINKNDVIG